MIPSALAPLAGHLLQSTIFAAAAGLLTLALRRNRASVRYWLWLAASYKFLVPFSLLVATGRLFQWRSIPARMVPRVVQLVDTVSGPLFLTASSPVVQAPQTQTSVFPQFAAAIWACGFLIVVARWIRQWIQIHAIVRAASPLPLGLPIRVVSTASQLEPGVFGIFRPVLVLPDGIVDRLTVAELQAVLAHELCHVRRRDNLAALLHMLVEAIFWFYPLVWWLGSNLIDERERACDEEVLRAGGESKVYAESILKVCRLYLEAPLSCVSGVTGSDLKKRIGRIMVCRFGEGLSFRRKWLLAITGAAALILPLLTGVLTVPWLVLAQSAAPGWQAAAGGKMGFDVASVKLDKERGRPNSNIVLLGDAYAPTGGLFSATNVPLVNYMRFAFKDMKLAYQATPDFAAAPGWVRIQQYDIEARAQGNPTKDQMRLMMQSLLADRFKLAFHYEKRQFPVYALVLAKEAKTGPDLKPDDGTCSNTPDDIKAIYTAPQLPSPASSSTSAAQIPCGFLMPVPPSTAGRMRIAGRKVPLALLASMVVSAPVTGVDRPVVDHTSLNGAYDIDFEFAPVVFGPAPPGFTLDSTGPTFIQALRDQLGLKLEPQTGPVDFLVIDHVEQPSAN